MAGSDFRGILRTLMAHGVEFIVVGGVSAVLHGAPITTFDLDIVHATDDDNVTRLIDALRDLDAIYRFQPDRRLTPERSHISGPGHQLLMTRYGPLDVLGAIGHGRTYADLLPHTEPVTLGESLAVRVLNLGIHIAVKEEIAAEKDRAVLPILRRTLEEKRNQ